MLLAAVASLSLYIRQLGSEVCAAACVGGSALPMEEEWSAVGWVDKSVLWQ